MSDISPMTPRGLLTPTPARRRADARGFFDTAASMFDAIGFDDAAKGIRRYRDGTGADERWSEADAARHPLIDAGRRSNQARFEANTFTGLKGRPAGGKSFLDLKDGESTIVEDDFNRNYNFKFQGSGLDRLTKPFRDAWAFASNPGTYLRLGQFGVRSKAKLTGTRRGNELHITGHVDDDLGPNGDRFDFNPGQYGHEQGKTLERSGEAKSFNTLYSSRSTVNAVARYEPDGSLTVNRSGWNLLR